MNESSKALSPIQRTTKRIFDIGFSGVGLVLCMPVLVTAWAIASLDTRSNGFFFQERIGRNGMPFKLIKIKTMVLVEGVETSITTADDCRITKIGRLLRKTKIDELPQLWNVLIGDMSFVGPRPDVAGYADNLEGEDRLILSIRPGITGPAAIKYRNEEEILARQENPVRYNDEVIWPDKIRINHEYIRNYSLLKDFLYICKSIVG
ncbi:MAG: sugar transferase [Cyclobacteriaceae bacterium]|nr:sugar transferase [Cyclobacteriaceae bacterium]